MLCFRNNGAIDGSSNECYRYRVVSCLPISVHLLMPFSVKILNAIAISINHFKHIDSFYNNIMESLVTAACNAIPVGDTFSIGKTFSTGYSIIPGWNSSIKNARATARKEYLNWLNIGKPLPCPTYCLMKKCRRNFE